MGRADHHDVDIGILGQQGELARRGAPELMAPVPATSQLGLHLREPEPHLRLTLRACPLLVDRREIPVTGVEDRLRLIYTGDQELRLLRLGYCPGEIQPIDSSIGTVEAEQDAAEFRRLHLTRALRSSAFQGYVTFRPIQTVRG